MRLPINGISLNVETAGEGAPALLLVHGLGGSARQWAGAAALLSTSSRCVMPDLRNHGASDRSGAPVSVKIWADDLAAVCKALDVPRCIAVGASVGAAVVLQFAADHPELAAGVVTIGGFPSQPPAARERMTSRAAEVEAKGVAAVAEAVVAGQLGASTHANNPALVGVQRAMLLENDATAYAASTRAVAAADVTGALPLVQCPVLITWGAEEKVAPMPLQRALRRGLPQATLRCLPDAGHLAFFEQPRAFAAVLQEFAASLIE
jgi:pimeloyl-ACP methyl ester carboxylesterase